MVHQTGAGGRLLSVTGNHHHRAPWYQLATSSLRSAAHYLYDPCRRRYTWVLAMVSSACTCAEGALGSAACLNLGPGRAQHVECTHAGCILLVLMHALRMLAGIGAPPTSCTALVWTDTSLPVQPCTCSRLDRLVPCGPLMLSTYSTFAL